MPTCVSERAATLTKVETPWKGLKDSMRNVIHPEKTATEKKSRVHPKKRALADKSCASKMEQPTIEQTTESKRICPCRCLTMLSELPIRPWKLSGISRLSSHLNGQLPVEDVNLYAVSRETSER